MTLLTVIMLVKMVVMFVNNDSKKIIYILSEETNMYTHINWYTDLNKLIIKKFAKLKLSKNIKNEKKPVIIDCLTLIYGVCEYKYSFSLKPNG